MTQDAFDKATGAELEAQRKQWMDDRALRRVVAKQAGRAAYHIKNIVMLHVIFLLVVVCLVLAGSIFATALEWGDKKKTEAERWWSKPSPAVFEAQRTEERLRRELRESEERTEEALRARDEEIRELRQKLEESELSTPQEREHARRKRELNERARALINKGRAD